MKTENLSKITGLSLAALLALTACGNGDENGNGDADGGDEQSEDGEDTDGEDTDGEEAEADGPGELEEQIHDTAQAWIDENTSEHYTVELDGAAAFDYEADFPVEINENSGNVQILAVIEEEDPYDNPTGTMSSTNSHGVTVFENTPGEGRVSQDIALTVYEEHSEQLEEGASIGVGGESFPRTEHMGDIEAWYEEASTLNEEYAMATEEVYEEIVDLIEELEGGEYTLEDPELVEINMTNFRGVHERVSFDVPIEAIGPEDGRTALVREVHRQMQEQDLISQDVNVNVIT